jgi:ankyrin repeat protein
LNARVLLDFGRSPVLLTAIDGGNVKTVERLLELGVDVNDLADCDMSGLWYAASRCSVDIGKLLLEKGAWEHAKTLDNATLLHAAALGGCPQLLNFFLNSGSSVDARSLVEGVTPLMLAAKKGPVESLKILLDHGADIDLADDNGLRATDWAANSPENMKCLIERRGTR